MGGGGCPLVGGRKFSNFGGSRLKFRFLSVVEKSQLISTNKRG